MASPVDLEIKTRRWRRIEYERLVELGMFTGERLELPNGLLVVPEPQGSPHASIVSQVARVLERAFGPGWHARQHAPLALDDDSEPEPDVAMVPGEPRAYYATHPSTAGLVVEVAIRRRAPRIAMLPRSREGGGPGAREVPPLVHRQLQCPTRLSVLQ